MIWRNEHFLFRGKDIFGKEVFSSFPPEIDIKIMESHDWLGDLWDQDASAQEYDWNKPFFEQFLELRKTAPVPSRSVSVMVNSDYSNNGNRVKDSYLVFGAMAAEQCYYSENLTNCKDCFDSSSVVDCEISYESFMNLKCYKSFYSSFCEDCHDISFCTDCVGCSDCFGCVGLKNKSHCFFNQSLPKEEYAAKVADFKPGTKSGLLRAAEEFKKFRLGFPVKYAKNYRNDNCTGEYVSNSRNVKKSYNVIQGENLKYCQFLFSKNAKDSYDHYRYGENTELIYESGSCGTNSSRVMFSYQCWSNCSNLQYCYQCLNSSDCFGCVALHHKKYCILNKQYSKEEYENLVPKMIKHMEAMPYTDKVGRIFKYGEFFPPEISPQTYNTSIVQEFFPLKKEEAIARGYIWHELEKRDHRATKEASELPDATLDASEEITREIFGCEHGGTCDHQCTKAFRILAQELAFYERYNIVLPRICPNCRYFERISQRAPIQLWNRVCQCAGAQSASGAYQNTTSHFHKDGQCPNSFETSYAPDRPEIVYCEQCYNAEVA